MWDMEPKDIKKLRLRLGFSQADFAMLVGVNQATVSKWETGSIGISRLAYRAMEPLQGLTRLEARNAWRRLKREAA